MAAPGHLVKRFATSLFPVGPKRSDDDWARSSLLDGEADIWDSMSPADRRHAVGVARRVVDALGATAVRPVVAAALLHDCGKVRSGFGTFNRVVATVVAAAVGREAATAWQDDRGGYRRRVGQYLDHPRIGAEMLGAAGSSPLTVAWAAEHHLPAHQWTVDLPVGEALKDADDD